MDHVKLLMGSLLLCLSVATIAGCGKDYGVELYRVTGTITLDGQPLGDASVQFRPDTTYEVIPPRGGIGYTDDTGKYVMLFKDTRGCPEGRFHVVVSTYSEGTKSSGQELVPAKYRGQNTILSATVTPDGDNVFDFELLTK